ncbi:hypothetical protein EDC94DRAFT_252086 [Helicostylum pulchrum]|nr:hypothetical protein EDC94DRAFT_252086 [Helicostylum pulchrum]
MYALIIALVRTLVKLNFFLFSFFSRIIISTDNICVTCSARKDPLPPREFTLAFNLFMALLGCPHRVVVFSSSYFILQTPGTSRNVHTLSKLWFK